MGFLELWQRGQLIDRSAGLRIAEPYPASELDEPSRNRGTRIRNLDPELAYRPPHEDRIAGQLGCGHQQQPLRCGWQRREPLLVAFPDRTGQLHRAGQPEPARQFVRSQSGQLQQRSRVAPCFSHHAVADPIIQDADDGRMQQRVGAALGQAADHQLRVPGQDVPTARLAHREHQRGRLGRQPASHKGKGLRRSPVQPLRIVHGADQRPFTGHLR